MVFGLDGLLGSIFGSVELASLSYQHTDFDGSYPGVEIGRRYFSDMPEGIFGCSGEGWAHSFEERLGRLSLEPSSSDQLVHVNWDHPHPDPLFGYTDDGNGAWVAPLSLGSRIEPATGTDWPGAAYKLLFKDGRIHYFNVAGLILARMTAAGHPYTQFEYDAGGNLNKVVDVRGSNFLVSVDAGGKYDTITDPSGNSIVYDVDPVLGLLDRVTYPARDVHQNTIDSSGDPIESPWASSENRTTERSYDYNGYHRLTDVRNDSGVSTLTILYQTDDPNNFSPNPTKVWQVVNAAGGIWQYDEDTVTSYVMETDPRGFQKEYVVYNRAVIEVRQYIQNVDDSVLDRPATGYEAWLLNRPCDCGLISKVTEPDGGSWAFVYNAAKDLTHVTQNPSDSGEPRTWKWTYTGGGRVSTFAPPEANALADPAQFTYTYTYVNLPPTHPVAPDGLEVQVSNPAGGIRPMPTTWVHRYDSLDRLVETDGPSHDGVGPGQYHRYDYYGPNQGNNAFMLKKHYTRRDLSLWTRFFYNANGDIFKGKTQDGDVFLQHWNAAGQLIAWEGPDRGSQRYRHDWVYDAEFRVSKLRYKYYAMGPTPSGGGLSNPDPFDWVETSVWYDDDSSTRFVRWDVDTGVDATIEYRYDPQGLEVYSRDPDGLVSTIYHDEKGLPWIITEAAGTSEELQTTYDYRHDGQLTLETSPLDSRLVEVHYEYDAFDRLQAVQVEDQNRVEIAYDPADRVTWLGHFGNVSGQFELIEAEDASYMDWHQGPTVANRYVYDAEGSAILRQITTVAEYGPSGSPRTITINGNVYARIEVEPWGDLKRLYDDHGNIEEFAYDSANGYRNLHRVTQDDPVSGGPLVIERQFERDAAGRVTKVTWVGDGEPAVEESFEYDSLDNIVQRVDPKGRVTESDYRYDDALKELRRNVDPGTGIPQSRETYTYTPGGLVQTVTDNRQNTVTWTYNALNRLYQEIQADGKFWQYEYTEGGYLERITTPTNKKVDLVYNLRGLVESRIVSDASSNVLRSDVIEWDPSGGLKKVTKTEGSVISFVEFTRDSLGGVITEDQDGYLVTYTRDGLGRLDTLAGPGSVREYAYDNFNRVAALRDGAGADIATMEYLGSSRALRRLSLRGGMRTDILRDGFGRPSSIQTVYGPSTVFDYEYEWDLDGTLLFEDRLHDANGDVYRYDDLGRLQEFTRNSADPSLEIAQPGSTVHELVRDYNLDADFHRSSVVTTPYGGSATTTAYSTHADRHHYTDVGGVARTMDDDGNVLSIGALSFIYDAMDNLVEVKDGAVTVATYEYDALDRRISKSLGSVSQRFVNAGGWVLEEYRKDGAGPEELDAVHYSGGGTDNVIMSERVDRSDLDGDGDTTEFIELFLHKNQLGSVMDLTLADGTIVESYRYDAFGAPRIFDKNSNVVGATPSGNKFLFTGREYDEETGFYHYRARAYDPGTGTFLQEDPLGLVDSVNPVAYVLGDPMRGVTLLDGARVTIVAGDKARVGGRFPFPFPHEA